MDFLHNPIHAKGEAFTCFGKSEGYLLVTEARMWTCGLRNMFMCIGALVAGHAPVAFDPDGAAGAVDPKQTPLLGEPSDKEVVDLPNQGSIRNKLQQQDRRGNEGHILFAKYLIRDRNDVGIMDPMDDPIQDMLEVAVPTDNTGKGTIQHTLLQQGLGHEGLGAGMMNRTAEVEVVVLMQGGSVGGGFSENQLWLRGRRKSRRLCRKTPAWT